MKYWWLLLLVLASCTTQVETTEINDYHNIDYPFEEVSAAEEEALLLALNDEYKAFALYTQVIADFGEVKPFSNIINAEANHIAELVVIFDKYDLSVPENNWLSAVDSYASVADACAAGVSAEVENADLYDKLLVDVDNQDIQAVFMQLRDASRLKHLPAFQRCGGHV